MNGSKSQWPAARSKELSVFVHSNTGIMGSNTTQGMAVIFCLLFLC
jgi:hypothetical protein